MASVHVDKRFKCKYEGCAYSEGSTLYFLKYQYLKQHYDKVHSEKIYPCPLCSKKFATTTLQKCHISYCGKEFKCSCGVVYKSNEALLTHAKRKNHPLGPIPRTKNNNKELSTKNSSSVSVNLPAGAQFIILHTNNQFPDGLISAHNLNEKGTQDCPMHIMAAVALSELSSTTPVCTIPEKREISTQTENHGSDLWLSTAQTETIQLISKIHDSGTQTEEIDFNEVISPDSPQNPSSPWLGLSAETQTVDEDAVLRPFNLCNIQTQTPWNEMSDDDTTELAHTETQTLLSSFFIEDSNIPECQGERSTKAFLVKQTSEDAGTDPMEIFDWSKCQSIRGNFNPSKNNML